jgi:Ala-tRNA(Pro) deacylase
MGIEDQIRQVMNRSGVPIECREHEPVYTNPAMAIALGVKESETVKSLVIKTKEGNFAVLVLPGDKRMDWKLVAARTNSKKVGFAKPEEVLKIIGCEVGCVPPFGHITELPILMDAELLKKDLVYFNPGVHDKSFKIKSMDLKTLCKAKII